MNVILLQVPIVAAKYAGCRPTTLTLRRGQQVCHRICVKEGVRNQCNRMKIFSRVSVCPLGCCQLGDSCVSLISRKF